MSDGARNALDAYIDHVVREARAQERAVIVSDLIEWSRPLGESPEDDAMRLIIARISTPNREVGSPDD